MRPKLLGKDTLHSGPSGGGPVPPGPGKGGGPERCSFNFVRPATSKSRARHGLHILQTARASSDKDPKWPLCQLMLVSVATTKTVSIIMILLLTTIIINRTITMVVVIISGRIRRSAQQSSAGQLCIRPGGPGPMGGGM